MVYFAANFQGITCQSFADWIVFPCYHITIQVSLSNKGSSSLGMKFREKQVTENRHHTLDELVTSLTTFLDRSQQFFSSHPCWQHLPCLQDSLIH